MLSVQKINFKANTPSLLQQNFATGSVSATKNLPSVNQSTQETPVVNNSNNDAQALKTAKTVSYVSASVALMSMGVVTVLAVKNGKMSKALKELKEAKPSNIAEDSDLVKKIADVVSEKVEILKSDITKTVNEQIGDLKNVVEENKKIAKQDTVDLGKWHDGQIAGAYDQIKEKAQYHDGWIRDVEGKIGTPQNVVMERNLGYIDGLRLLKNVDNDGNRIGLPQELITRFNKMSESFLYNGPNRQQTKLLGPGSTVYSVASEAVPEKEGGVGEVVVQSAVNMKKELGIENYVVKPLYEIAGRSKIVKEGDKCTYFFDLDKAKKYEMPAKKVMEYDIPTYRNSRLEMQKIEVYTGTDPKTGYETIMFSNHDYMSASGIYKNSPTASETERFALFPKAVYEFIKFKKDPNSLTKCSIFDKTEFDNIKAPDGIVVNDWHAAGLVPLMKAKSLIEAHYGELSKQVAEELHSTCVDDIVHNACYQGSDWRHSGEVINTLFDKYAYDLHEHLNSGFDIDGLRKVFTLGSDNHANLANMAALLSNFVEPVSPHYAHELATMGERSGAMQHVFDVRLSQGTMQGCGNGWDRVVNEVSEKNLPSYLNSINNDKFEIFKSKLLEIPGLNSDVKAQISKHFEDGLTADSFNSKINELQALNNPEITKVIKDLEHQGITKLRSYKPYTNKDSSETILAARKFNKQMMWEHACSMIEYNKNNDKKLFNIIGLEHTDLSKIKPEELGEIPFISFGVRFVTQKGVDITSGIIETLQKTWATKFPGKHKPVFIMGGADGEGGKIKQIAVDAKYRMKNDGEDVFYMDGYAPNNLFHAGSDLAISPSLFEPDGSAREAMYRGTPVAATRVGGQVNTVKDGINGYLAKEGLSPFDGMMEALDRFFTDFYNKEPYNKLVRTTIDDEGSWVIKNDEGKIIGGALLKRLKHLNFDLSKFPQIEMSAEEIQKL